jgi:cholesterol transport system auxiliary component
MKNNPMFTPNRRLFLVGASALGLSACGNLLGPGEAPQIYTLHPAIPALPAGAPAGWALAVGLPDASAALDTQRIALTRSGTTMDYYANAAWPDTLTLLVQGELLGAFQDCGRLGAVAREQDALHADYTLVTDIREFTAHYSDPDGAPRATVTIVAQIVASHGRKTVASLTASESAAASVNSVDAAVQAFNAAFGSVIGKIVAWVVALPPPPTGPVAAP